jgi:hypothetical protein
VTVLGGVSAKKSIRGRLTAERRASRGREGGGEEEREREREREREIKGEREKKKATFMASYLRKADSSPPQAIPAAGVAICKWPVY